jgi:hypothetical protein
MLAVVPINAGVRVCATRGQQDARFMNPSRTTLICRESIFRDSITYRRNAACESLIIRRLAWTADTRSMNLLNGCCHCSITDCRESTFYDSITYWRATAFLVRATVTALYRVLFAKVLLTSRVDWARPNAEPTGVLSLTDPISLGHKGAHRERPASSGHRSDR